MFGRQKIAMLVAEFIGTFTLSSVVLAMVGRQLIPFFTALSAGAVLSIMVLAIGEVSGAHLNPAVTLSLWWIRQVQAAKAIVFIAAQMLGGLVAITLNEYLLGKSLPNIAGPKFEVRVLVAEAVGTALFTFVIASAVSQGYKGLKKATTIGGGLALGIVVASFGSNAILNPAVAASVQSWNWAYATGPLLGGLVGVSLYTLLFAPRPAKAVKAVAASKAVAAKTTKAKKPAKKAAPKKRAAKK